MSIYALEVGFGQQHTAPSAAKFTQARQMGQHQPRGEAGVKARRARALPAVGGPARLTGCASAARTASVVKRRTYSRSYCWCSYEYYCPWRATTSCCLGRRAAYRGDQANKLKIHSVEEPRGAKLRGSECRMGSVLASRAAPHAARKPRTALPQFAVKSAQML
jgi:hypothetical protein